MASHLLTNYDSSHSFQSVKELVKKPLASVPQSFVCLDDHEPIIQNETLYSVKLPIIDMKKLVLEKATDSEMEKLHSACTDWGFFQLVNHGLSPPMLEKLKDDVQEFFNLSVQEKMKFKIRPGDSEGYGVVMRSDNEKLDWGDRFYMTTNPVNKRKRFLFPELPSSFRTILDSYILEVQNIAMTLLGLLAQSLKIDKREMELFEDGMQSMRITYYPPCPQPDQVRGFTAHSDGSGITILNQVNGVQGLQIKKEGIWIPVNVLFDALIVNIGDILEIMSNGAYKSVEHRVTVNSDKERMSIAMFFNPKLESEFGPVLSLTDPQNHPPLFQRIGMEKYVKDFFSRKLNGKSNLEPLRIKNEDLLTP